MNLQSLALVWCVDEPTRRSDRPVVTSLGNKNDAVARGQPRVRADFYLAIDVSPMTDSDNVDGPLSIIDTVNNAVVANSDAPQVLFAL